MIDRPKVLNFYEVNSFVFSNPEYEDLQNLCITLIKRLEKAEKVLTEIKYCDWVKEEGT